MSKKIEIKSERWSGSVTIADPLTIPQAKLIEAGMKSPPNDDANENGRIWLSVVDEMQLPAVIACVEKWELADIPENVTIDNFPASPRGSSHALISEIFRELLKVYFGEIELPNA